MCKGVPLDMAGHDVPVVTARALGAARVEAHAPNSTIQ
jgi:hypothetical protein